MSLIQLSTSTLALILVVTFVLWLVSLRLRDVSIVDIFWGLGFVMVAFWCAAFSESPTARQVLALALVTTWGVRLAGYLAWRNHGKGEDPRYAEMRGNSPDSFWWVSLFKVFWLQGLLMWFISMPLQVIMRGDQPLGVIDAVAAVVWLVGLIFEAGGDFQLARFKQKREDSSEVMDSGLWRYTRHPNYFGDFLIWWSYYLIAVASADHGWWTIGSPLVMSALLMKFSGVGLLEKSLNDKPKYAEYVERTNAFFPGPPKTSDA